jgi:prolyl-tRNA synthetase
MAEAISKPESVLTLEINEIGDEIRKMKAAKLGKDDIAPTLQKLLALKAEYERTTGTQYDKPKAIKGDGSKPTTQKKGGSDKGEKDNSSKQGSGAVSDSITPRSTDYSAWYNDIIYASDMVDQSAVRGCMVIKPWGMSVWDLLKHELDCNIKEMDVQNAYFPLFIPQSFLSKEAEHVDGFAKECAVVTHHRLCSDGTGGLIPDPDAKLEEPLIVRPTSETVIWNMFGKWINSYRDLPLRINQWANVVRWEMRTRPFLRTSEFLWQEGHTAHATPEDAQTMARDALDMYARVCKDMLALPTVKGVKSPSERFAGAEDTYTIEALMQNGWALQSGTSHYLGQNFARAFDVYFQTANKQRELVWATSWGVSTRLIGALIMSHSDDKGLVLPPPIAPFQIVLVPITNPSKPDDQAVVLERIQRVYDSLKKAGLRVKIDDRENMRPGAKYFEWERKGVPLRIDIGPRDVANDVVVTANRVSGEKSTFPCTVSDLDSGAFAAATSEVLRSIHDTLFDKASSRVAKNTFVVKTYDEMKSMMDGDTAQTGFYQAYWKCDSDNEELIKKECKATIRCYPFDKNMVPPTEGTKCFFSGEQATQVALFARAF